jgi:NAD(P)-dependent dehydrogenase (short-subunit alcohol dehydrogenase family)
MKPVNSLLDLSEKNILVTGAAGNIGSAIARRLAEAGARVALHYHTNKAHAQQLQREIGPSALTVQGNLASTDGVEQIFAALRGAEFELNAIVNNAADQSVALLAEMSFDEWRQVLATNLDGPFLVCQTALSVLPAGASIVNISSIESLDPAVGHGHYATSKAGMNMLTRALALEIGDTGIRINSISPGLIRREGIETAWPEGIARWQARAPLSRLGEPEDVADATLFLISDAARWITGSNLIVDGGMSAQSKW